MNGMNKASAQDIWPDPNKKDQRWLLAAKLKERLEFDYCQKIEWGIPIPRIPDWDREDEFIEAVMAATGIKDRFQAIVQFVGNTTHEMRAAMSGDLVPLSDKMMTGKATNWEATLAGFLLRPAPKVHGNTKTKYARRKEDEQVFAAAMEVKDIERILLDVYAPEDLPRRLTQFAEEMAAKVWSLHYSDDDTRSQMATDLQQAIADTRNRVKKRNITKG